MSTRIFGGVNASGELVTPLGPLPDAIAAWSDEQVRDLSAVDPSFGLTGLAFWRATIAPAVLDPATEVQTDEILDVALHPDTATITARYGKRALTPAELAARQPPPAHLTHLQFVRHAMASAGLTPEGFLAAKADPNLAFFWAMFDLAGDIERDDAFTREGAEAWVLTGHISEAGRDAIFATWPGA